jgi:RNA polymerase sigma factor (sigma-70 family)
MLTSGEDALDHLLSSIEKDAVRKAIRSLDPPQQELVLDVYYRGLSMAAVARRDKVSKMAVTNRMKKIIKRLQENLKDF